MSGDRTKTSFHTCFQTKTILPIFLNGPVAVVHVLGNVFVNNVFAISTLFLRISFRDYSLESLISLEASERKYRQINKSETNLLIEEKVHQSIIYTLENPALGKYFLPKEGGKHQVQVLFCNMGKCHVIDLL